MSDLSVVEGLIAKVLAQRKDLTRDKIRGLIEQKKEDFEGLLSDQGAARLVVEELLARTDPVTSSNTMMAPKESGSSRRSVKSMSDVSVYVSNAEYVERRTSQNGLTSAIDQVVREARELVWIAVPWFYTSTGDAWITSLMVALSARCKQGLDVRLFVRPDVSNHQTVNILNLAGVKVFSKKEIIRHIHTKMVLNESTLLAVTANITDFDLYRNMNTGILTHSATEVEKARRDFQRLVEPDIIKQTDFSDVEIDSIVPQDVAVFFREKYPKLNPVQVAVAPYVLQRSENLMIGTETGTGKTCWLSCAFGICCRRRRERGLCILLHSALSRVRESKIGSDSKMQECRSTKSPVTKRL